MLDFNKTDHYSSFKPMFAKVLKILPVLIGFLFFFSLLIDLGVQAYPEDKLMVVVIEIMAIAGLCFPVKIVHPFWKVSNLNFFALRVSGSLAVLLSWLTLHQGVEMKKSKSMQQESYLASYQKAIDEGWKEFESLPENYFTKREKLRNNILDMQGKLLKTDMRGAMPLLGMQQGLYRFLILVFSLLLGHSFMGKSLNLFCEY